MPRPYSPPKPRLPVRLATAAAGVLALGVGWRLTAAEPPAPTAPVEAVPADYVPDTPAAFDAPAGPDPLAITVPASADRAIGAPLDYLRITSGFGMRRHPILGFTRMHQGVDLAARMGSPVLAAADGVVTEAGREGGYGEILRLRHAGGWATGYAHLSGFAPGVAPGARVERGQIVAFVGQTGLATGPHLHYEVSYDGVKLDPLKTPFGGVPGGIAATPANTPPDLTQASGLRLRPAELTDAGSPKA
jgi:murein DD-endopeptidase MepM/ murein hydrolase activator NlpD